MATRVTDKGQGIIPAEIRAAAGIGPGSEIEWGYDPVTRRILAVKAGLPPPAISHEEALRRIDSAPGTADAGLTTDEIMRLMRGDIDD